MARGASIHRHKRTHTHTPRQRPRTKTGGAPPFATLSTPPSSFDVHRLLQLTWEGFVAETKAHMRARRRDNGNDARQVPGRSANPRASTENPSCSVSALQSDIVCLASGAFAVVRGSIKLHVAQVEHLSLKLSLELSLELSLAVSLAEPLKGSRLPLLPCSESPPGGRGDHPQDLRHLLVRDPDRLHGLKNK